MTKEGGPDQRLSQVEGSETTHRQRRTRRVPIHGHFVAIDAPEVSSEPWVVDAIDLNSSGVGLVLPPELLEGTGVLLSFRLGSHDFSRLPATVQHQTGVSGGLRFGTWPEAERLKLLEYLVPIYETID
ncbi:MAG: PilZ domain-containing protein [Acidobacteriota bacterium]